MGRGGLLLDFVYKTAAEFGEANRSAIVGLIAARGSKKIVNVFGEDVLPIREIMTSDDGENLFLAKVGRN